MKAKVISYLYCATVMHFNQKYSNFMPDQIFIILFFLSSHVVLKELH